MNKKEFLVSEPVRSFISWVEPKLDTPGSFRHEYWIKRFHTNWECDSLYSAYEGYNWPFNAVLPGKIISVSGITFKDSYEFLEQLSGGLRRSIENDDPDLCRQHCLAVLKWGGVSRGNINKITELGNGIIHYFKYVKNNLGLDKFNAKSCGNVIMNSGFSKIYALLVDGLIIYDGRVGAALGLLVRQFCEELGLNKVPDELLFGFGTGREAQANFTDRRNPGNHRFKFPRITGNPRKHLQHNVMASWLLKEIIDTTDSRFNQLTNSVDALQAALFMIGCPPPIPMPA